MLSRRALLAGGAALAASSLAPSVAGFARGDAAARRLSDPSAGRRLTLSAGEMELNLLGEGRPATRILAYDGEPFRLIRAKRGERLDVEFSNGLDEGSTVHWHGIRLPIEFDGVPTLTQPLVPPGGSFAYRVPLDDPGTFFFHPHCDETGQAGKGLAGILIVDDPRDPEFDAEHIFCLKDWRLAEDGTFLAMSEPDGAAKAGTYGATRTVNGKPSLTLEAPANGDVRLRILNVDSTRIMDISVEGADAALIAVDGHALIPIHLDDLPDGVWRMGPAQRIDLHLRMPAAGGEVRVGDYRSADIYHFATLKAAASPLKKRPFRALALPAAQLPRPDVKRAQRYSFTLQQATDAAIAQAGLPPDDPLAKALLDSLCVGAATYWAINQEAWPTGARRAVPPPLARMSEGKSYRVEIRNGTRFAHPVHLHGHAFEVIASGNSRLPRHFCDTVLVGSGEAVEIAFVAAPGDWVFHCHILEHMETGMMGYFRVT
ncbi:multicopper oxidase family protein [Ancylobacter terrae]|uniref:multicopper oxidase family protein n=1 Tax=Ancylobacter sp. sgz301288 TaxID=3342077 RepID=UPI00385F38DA